MKRFNITVSGTTYDVLVDEVPVDGATLPIPTPTTPIPQAIPTPIASVAPTAPIPQAVSTPAPVPAATPTSAPVGEGIKVTSPMPGNVLRIPVTVGQSIKKGAILVILEAMKMENEIMSAQDGVIISINVKEGTTVDSGTLLVVIG